MKLNRAVRNFVLVYLSSLASAADWPMYRADAGRSGCTPESLPAKLELRWTYRSATPRPAWPSSERLAYDFAHQPILMGDTVVLGSTVDDSVVALDAADGRMRWKFLTGGPVRFAAAGWRDRVFVASDDGWLYALALADGRVLWKHRGGPDSRMCLGNERMISRWPARGGPVVVEDTVYYAAGIWPSGGVHIHALDAESGRVVWSNDRTGQMYMPQPHCGAKAQSGVAPQGNLLAAAEHLFVPTGRAVPAAFRRADGELEHYLLQENGSIGGSRALVADKFVVNGGCFLEQATGKLAARAGRGVFSVAPEGVLQFTGAQLLAYRWGEVETRDRKGHTVLSRGLKKHAQVDLSPETVAVRRAALASETLKSLKPLFRTDIVFKDADPAVAQQTGLERVLSQSRPEVEQLGASVRPFMPDAYERACEIIAAGGEAVCGSSGSVAIVDLKTNCIRWKRQVKGDAVGLAAAQGTLLVSTTAGVIYCFGEGKSAAPVAKQSTPAKKPSAEDADSALTAKEVLQKSGVREGFCLVAGCGDGGLALELARKSKLHVIAIESDPAKVGRTRQMLADTGVYGSRVSVIEGKLDESLFPRYFADLIVSSAPLDNALIEKLQRPDGGVICFGQPGSLQVRRRGPLEGAGLWTHQNSDAANTLCSDDTLVRGPLEISWYHNGTLEIADRHAQAPAPLFNHGVLVVEGVHGLCGMDAYNGRPRWVYPIAKILSDWDGVHHDVGVGEAGSNFCLGDDSVFVRTGRRCLKLDLATGRKLAEFTTPADGASTNRNWGYVAYADGLLYGTALNNEHTVSVRYQSIRMRTESVLLFAYDAKTGKLLWRYKPEHSLRNNAIAISDGRLYLIDRPLALADRITAPKPTGKQGPPLKPGDQPGGTMVALDARSGAALWKTNDDVFGTQLAVSSKQGVLLMFYQAVKHKFFKLPSEVGGRLAAFNTANGQRLWDQAATHKTRPIINGDTIYAEGGAWKIKTGEEVPWSFERSYGCGQIAASRHLMLFRSATLGYLDLSRDAGTENFGGIRPSCWFNAIPAGGMVLVPDGSSKCACSYQMQAWLALQPAEPR
ncbi:MAG: PQQ-binding-like beta-propeller repeat protein [Verrucomicrobia bacterium]|nr:PQQ-binding-like beta-propeller repeat protein [Verrucomicrobiota bacterium]